MNPGETFVLLRTCVIGEAHEACGVGFDPEDAMEAYHLADFHERVDPDDVRGSHRSPEAFLEAKCESNAGRIYETIRLMEASWRLNTRLLLRDGWQRSIGRALWGIGAERSVRHLGEVGEEGDSDAFRRKGDALFS